MNALVDLYNPRLIHTRILFAHISELGSLLASPLGEKNGI